MTRWIFLTGALAVAAALGGCLDAPTGPLRFSAASDMQALTPAAAPAPEPELWDAASVTVSLFAAGNETVSFQLVIDAPQGVSGLKVQAEALSSPGGGKIAPEQFRFYRMWPVAIGDFTAAQIRLAQGPLNKAPVYDALQPLQPASQDSFVLPPSRFDLFGLSLSRLDLFGLSHSRPAAFGLVTGPKFTLAPGQRLALWVDANVPRNVPGGLYTGSLVVDSSAGRQRISLRLKVYDFVLPDSRPMLCLGGYSYQSIFAQFVRTAAGEPLVPAYLDTGQKETQQGLALIRRLMRLAHEHRMDLFDPTLRPVLKRDGRGKPTLRWDEYDKILRPYADGSAFDDHVGISAWPVPFSPDWPDSETYGGFQDPAYRLTALAVLEQSVTHLDELGLGRAAFFWPSQTQLLESHFGVQAILARMARSAAPSLPVLNTLSTPAGPDVGFPIPEDMGFLTDMLAPPGHLLDAQKMHQGLKESRPLDGLYLRPGDSPYVGSLALGANPADARSLAWAAARCRCKGILMPDVLDWRGFGAPSGQALPAGVGEECLFYPSTVTGGGGEADVLPSARLKRLHRGLQDVSYLWLLRRRGRTEVAEEMLAAMIHYVGADSAADNPADPRLNGWPVDGRLWEAARARLAEECQNAIRPSEQSNRELLQRQQAWQELQQKLSQVRLEQATARLEVVSAGVFRARVELDLYNEHLQPATLQLHLDALPPGWHALAEPVKLDALAGGARAKVVLEAQGEYLATGAAAKMDLPVVMTGDGQSRRGWVVQVPFLLAGYVSLPIQIDGDLHDWPFRPGNTAAGFRLLGLRGQGKADESGNVQMDSALAKRQSAVFALHDDKDLYLAFRCDEPEMANLVARPDNQVRAQQLMAMGEDLVEVVLDPGGRAKGPQDMYHVIVKPSGIVICRQGVVTLPSLGGNAPWSCGIRVAVGRQEKVWVVEMAIPLESFKSEGKLPTTWGVNFGRFTSAGAESSAWNASGRYIYQPPTLGAMFLVGPNQQLQLDPPEPARK